MERFRLAFSLRRRPRDEWHTAWLQGKPQVDGFQEASEIIVGRSPASKTRLISGPLFCRYLGNRVAGAAAVNEACRVSRFLSNSKIVWSS